MDIRSIFKEISEQLLSEFRKTASLTYNPGKGDLREGAFRGFLEEHLPTRYAIGRGQVITSENRISGQLDIVIYDPLHCPRFIASPAHSIFPVESVYGAISMKSNLDSEELKDGYQNIASLKAILPTHGFALHPSPGMQIGMSPAVPVSGIVAYASNRSLDAIAAQVQVLDAELTDINLRPDFVAVIGQGIVAPRQPLRGEFNEYKLPGGAEELAALRKTGRHTLMRLYIQILRELNALALRPLDLQVYDRMPRVIGKHRVGGTARFVKYPLNGPPSAGRAMRFTEKGIAEVVKKSTAVTLQQHMLNRFGQISFDLAASGLAPDRIVYEYNPEGRPPMPMDRLTADTGETVNAAPSFQPVHVVIDGNDYQIDLSALAADCLEDDPDYSAEELLSG